jgi:hypothetical protein
VDAICIDQESEHERNHQVSKMRTIYQGASQVRVWLGPPADDSDLAFELLHKLRHKISAPKSVEKILKHPKCRVRHFPAVLKLFQWEYWSRVWVVQEVISVRKVTVHCGSDYISWPDLIRVQEEVITTHIDILCQAALYNADLAYLPRAFLFGAAIATTSKG